MDWNKRDLEFLARSDCPLCKGEGRTPSNQRVIQPCDCSLKGIFRACYARFRDCVSDGRALSRVSFDRSPTGRSNRGMWGLKREEYMADFQLVARRSLTQAEHRLFRFHHILGASEAMCAKRLGISTLAVKYALQRLEVRLGTVFVSLEPYALYPLYDYFNKVRSEPVKPCRLPTARATAPVVPRLPVRQQSQRLIA